MITYIAPKDGVLVPFIDCFSCIYYKKCGPYSVKFYIWSNLECFGEQDCQYVLGVFNDRVYRVYLIDWPSFRIVPSFHTPVESVKYFFAEVNLPSELTNEIIRTIERPSI